MDYRRLVAAGIVGVLSALVVDIDAWAKSGGKYDWRLALARALKGLVTGLAAGAGIHGVAG